MNYWQEDAWCTLQTETDEVLDVNLWTDDNTGKQYITFYPTLSNDVSKANKVVAHYRVIKEE
tara:strand:+ start:609 stop:794 length:186 start_codon:yes stop_codon:yes gene_type:complete